MTPFTARLTFAAFVMVAFIITVNALLLQPAGKPVPAPQPAQPASQARGPSEPPRTIADLAAATSPAGTPPTGAAKQTAARPEAASDSSASERLAAAIVRELSRKGYETAVQDRQKALSAMVLAYEFDSDLPLSGTPDDAILKRLIFDLNRAPRGSFADRAEADPKLVLRVQKTLLELGFFSGSLTGRMDGWTQAAISAFERHRRLPVTERFSEETLLDLIAFTGKPIPRDTAAN